MKYNSVIAVAVIVIGVGATATTLLAIRYVPLGLPQLLHPEPPVTTEMQGTGTTTPIGVGIFTAPPIPSTTEQPKKDGSRLAKHMLI
jgi:hypothetical protein